MSKRISLGNRQQSLGDWQLEGWIHWAQSSEDSAIPAAIPRIESAAGVGEGGRTGLTAVFVGLFFLSAILLSPVASIIPAEATAPSLILVGLMMMTIVQDIPWTSYEEAIPAFVTLLLMPFTYSITNGIGAGFIASTLLKIASGRVRELHPLLLLAAAAFVVYFCLPIV